MPFHFLWIDIKSDILIVDIINNICANHLFIFLNLFIYSNNDYNNNSNNMANNK